MCVVQIYGLPVNIVALFVDVIAINTLHTINI